MNKLIKGIIGFEITIDKIEGKWKLNQNHSVEKRKNIIKELKAHSSYNSQQVALLMEHDIQE